MTVANSTMKWSAVGAGAVVAVPLTGSQVYDIDDLEVIVRTVATGIETDLVKTTDYTAAGIPGAAVTITTVATYTSASEIHVRRVGDYTQTNDFVQADSFPDAVVEQIADEDTMTLQVLKDAVDRALKFAKTSDDADIEFPDLVASKYVQINGTATGFTLADSGTTSDARVNSLFNGAAADDIFATYINLTNGALIIDGTGSPEASQVAPVGSIYLRTDGGADTSIYFKETGVSNTGWVARDTFDSIVATTVTANTSVVTDTISEKTGAAGVTIDTCLIKDGGVAAVTDQGGGSNLKTTMLDIGDWDMNAAATFAVAHGLTLANIRPPVTVMIRNDAKDTNYMFPYDVPNAAGEVDTIDATNVNLKRASAKIFDGVDFDDVGGAQETRGWVWISHI